jgi:Leucine-rich repeat (LRR) protein
MRNVICIPLIVTALFAAAPTFSWVENLGGSVNRDRAGQVTGVNLEATWVTDSDLPLLAEQKSLTTLDLGMTKISDRGLLDLKTLTNLTDVNLYYAETVTDQGLAVLKSWKNLKRLNLRGTKITDSTLQLLNGLTKLESLDIGFAQVTDSGLSQLSALSNLKEFSVGGNKLTDAGLQALRLMPLITDLDLSGAQRTDSGLWSVSLTDSGLETIATLQDLEHLRLNGINISPRGLDRISGLKKLSRLDLQSCSRINDDVVPILKSFPALKIVDLSATAVTDQGLAELHTTCPNLRILHSDFHTTPPAMPNGPAN